MRVYLEAGGFWSFVESRAFSNVWVDGGGSLVWRVWRGWKV